MIDAATVDGRRRLVLIRRDNVEHLLMIGGPDRSGGRAQYRARSRRARSRARAGASRRAAEPRARPTPTIENGWPLQPAGEPASAPASRPYRIACNRRALARRRSRAPVRARPTASPALPPNCRRASNPPDARHPSRTHEPAPRVPVAVAASRAAQADHNLAEMAQQLEAALRRAPAPEGRPPVTDPLAGQRQWQRDKSCTCARAPARELKRARRAEARAET